MNNVKYTVLPDRVLLIDNNVIISYKKGNLYYRKSISDKPRFICRLPGGFFQCIGTKISIIERLLRLEPRFAMPYKESLIYLSSHGKLFIIDYKTGSIEVVHEYRNKMHNPLNVCIVKNLKGFEDGLYYGEYWGNTAHEAVSVYHVDGRVSKKVYTFPAGSILHIHAIFENKKNDELILLTGDSDNESAVWSIRDGFKRVERICGGNQQYRSCCAYVDDHSLYYTTDTPLEHNYLYKYDIDQENLVRVYPLPGPSIYYMQKLTKSNKNMFVFSTSVEPDSRLVGGWKYRLSREKAPGVEDLYSHVFMAIDGKLKEIVKFKKDWLPFQLFQFGNVRIPYQNNSENMLFLSPQGVEKLHGKTVVVKIEEA